ncbi:MAG: hypothetical protein HFI80_11865 [Lachnospiraceae bacterium]|nr:hypothetical protein [uncultured Acetatifactor sp.]MCI9662202.1 hypothetical protein [Lachnospiraceae bacterium]
MAKKVDITEKLSFDGNPSLVIKGKELEVHADAATALKVMDALSDDPGPKQVVAMYKLLFPDESRKAIDKMHLNFQDFKTVVKGAITLITGEDGEEPGEAATHTTT